MMLQAPNEPLRLVDRLGDVERTLLQRGANTVQHSRWSLQLHLVGTFELLEYWRQRESLCLAGLLHSAYSTNAFRTGVFDIEDRALVREMIGTEAEYLAFLFCSIRRDELLESIRANDRSRSGDLTVRSWRDGRALTVTASQVGDLLLLHLANLAEQSCAADSSPSPWLGVASEVAYYAAAFSSDVPAIFSGCTSRIAIADEDHLVSVYGLATSSAAERALHIEPALRRAAEAVGAVGEPFVWLGLLALSRGDFEVASLFAERSLTLFDEWRIAWDKRLSYEQWRRIADYLLDIENCSAAECNFLAQQTRLAMRETSMRPEALFMRFQAMGALTSDEEVLRSARAATRTLGSEDTSLPPRFAQYVAGLSENLDEPRMMMYPGLSSSPWYDARLFPLARDLGRMASHITKEFAALDRARFHSESEAIEREGDWDVMLLIERGRRNPELCDACPVTMSIVESHRTVLGLAGLAYFSRLAPHTRVAPHRGPTNMRLRCHLGIEVPAGCGIVVGGIAGRWEAGQCLVFDDSQLHEVWNDSDSERIVLIVDLWHPDLTDREVELLEGLHAYADAHARNLVQYWEKNARTREAAVIRQPKGGR